MIFEDFQPHLHTIFRVQPENVDGLEQEWPLRLDDVALITNINALPQVVTRPPFSLLFRGDDHILLNQGAFTFHHDVLGEQVIFIVPIEHKDSSYIYQAIFS